MNTIGLSGEWRFAFDIKGTGLNYCGGWFERTLSETVVLPGSAVGNKKGIYNTMEDVDNRGDPWGYVGPAWYQKDFEIPPEAEDKNAVLILPRTCHTMVWVDETAIGESDCFQAPQVYELGRTAFPGKHRLTIRVDNSRRRPENYAPGRIPNGIVGDIRIEIRDSVYIKSVKVTPDLKRKRARIDLVLGNNAGIPVQGLLEYRTECKKAEASLRDKAMEFLIEKEEKAFWVEIFMGENFLTWDEFVPNLYDLEVRLLGKSRLGEYEDERSVQFGMRSLESHNKAIWCNGNAVYLRGDLSHIPQSAPLEKCRQLMKEYREWGINHLRFHTHTPSEEVLQAADEAGVYLQLELACRGNIAYPESPDFEPLLEPSLIKQGKRILEAFANHPSFVMLTLGNEISGDYKQLERVVAALREADPSRLYAQGSNNNLDDVFPLDGDDFFISNKAKNRGPLIVRGSASYADYPCGPIQNEDYPSTRRDLSEGAALHSVAILAHESGQYETTPNFDDLDEFPEDSKPRNLLIFKRTMEQKGLISKEKDFFKASGRLCVICYKEDLELTYRTPGFVGFQILSLNDALGQGSSLVGIRNVHGKDKSIVTKEAWRGFCEARVALLLMDGYTYRPGDTLCAEPLIVNFGQGPLNGATVVVELLDGEKVLQKITRTADLPQGARTRIDPVSFKLPRCETGKEFTLKVSIEGHNVKNSYSVWAFPEITQKTGDSGVAKALDKKTKEKLEAGESVLLMPGHLSKNYSIEGSFASNFWSFTMFRRMSLRKGLDVDPGTLGILVDTASPLFKYFPSDSASNWQWWQPLRNSRPVILDEFPKGLEPIVSVIDNPMRCARLALFFEAKVGRGKVLFSTFDWFHINTPKPESEALYEALKRYVSSGDFKPRATISLEDLKKLTEG
jgi:hypothetical protein